MPRKPRFYQAGVPAHVFQRGHNKEPVFFDDFDCQEYLCCLKRAADRYGCDIHAYVLMTNHVHLLLSPQRADAISKMFQGIGRDYVRYINQKYRRYGGLWEGRHKGNIVESSRYFLQLMGYIEMNPVRAGMVGHPAEYRWSSYAVNAMGESSAILRFHDEYLLLGETSQERCAVYRDILNNNDNVSIEEQKLIRLSLSSGTPLGGKGFKKKIEEVSGNKIGYSGRGRPAKHT